MNQDIAVLREIERARPYFSDHLDVIREITSGDIYLMGGTVSRTLNRMINGIECSKGEDIDFLVGAVNTEFELPQGWTQSTNKYGNPELITPYTEIDVVPIDTVNSIVRRQLVPTIHNFLTGTPLNVQSLVYNLQLNSLEGQLGVDAVLTKIIRVNNSEEARISAENKGITVDELLQEKKESMGFI